MTEPGASGMRTDGEQCSRLRKIQAILWQQHHLGSVIAVRTGDVPVLLTAGRVEVCAADGLDIWRDGNLFPDVSPDEAVKALVDDAARKPANP